MGTQINEIEDEIRVLEAFIYNIVKHLDDQSPDDENPDSYFQTPFDPEILKDLPRLTTISLSSDM